MSEVVSRIYDDRHALLRINEDCTTVAMRVANPLLCVLSTMQGKMGPKQLE